MLSSKPMSATLEQKIDQIQQQGIQTQQQIDKMLQVVIRLDVDMQDVKSRLNRVEDAQTRCFDKLDAFITMMKSNELEIVSLRSQYARLEERIEILEAARV